MLILVTLTGIIATFVGEYWGQTWIWASLGILVALWAWMSIRGVRYFDQVRHALGKRIHLRYTPELDFRYDETAMRALRIETILREVMPPSAENEGEAEGEPADSNEE